MSAPALHSFAVLPTGEDGFVHQLTGRFDAFVLDVPVITHVGRPSEAAHDAAARRAWWSAFSYLQQLGIGSVEPEEFAVYELNPDGTHGRTVTSGGLLDTKEQGL